MLKISPYRLIATDVPSILKGIDVSVPGSEGTTSRSRFSTLNSSNVVAEANISTYSVAFDEGIQLYPKP